MSEKQSSYILVAVKIFIFELVLFSYIDHTCQNCCRDPNSTALLSIAEFSVLLFFVAVLICIQDSALSTQGVHVAPLRLVRCGWLHAVAVGVLACIRLLPRNHVLLHLLFVPGRPRAFRQAGWT